MSAGGAGRLRLLATGQSGAAVVWFVGVPEVRGKEGKKTLQEVETVRSFSLESDDYPDFRGIRYATVEPGVRSGHEPFLNIIEAAVRGVEVLLGERVWVEIGARTLPCGCKPLHPTKAAKKLMGLGWRWSCGGYKAGLRGWVHVQISFQGGEVGGGEGATQILIESEP